jgi:hypothetical protein
MQAVCNETPFVVFLIHNVNETLNFYDHLSLHRLLCIGYDERRRNRRRRTVVERVICKMGMYRRRRTGCFEELKADMCVCRPSISFFFYKHNRPPPPPPPNE